MKTSGRKLARSETVTVRLDPKLRYLAELAAAKHRRTLSSFIEWVIEESLRDVKLREDDHETGERAVTLFEESANLWDVDDADRFAKLAFKYPELLTHEEQKRWKLIRENNFVWKAIWGSNNRWKWDTWESELLYARLREHWDAFCAVARGEKDASVLPSRPDRQAIAEEPNFDEDIPF